MPIISIFYGIVIRIFHDDHNPPHFHAQYGEYTAVIEISSGKVLVGDLPPRVLKLIENWRRDKKLELLNAWKFAVNGKTPKKIKPLE